MASLQNEIPKQLQNEKRSSKKETNPESVSFSEITNLLNLIEECIIHNNLEVNTDHAILDRPNENDIQGEDIEYLIDHTAALLGFEGEEEDDERERCFYPPTSHCSDSNGSTASDENICIDELEMMCAIKGHVNKNFYGEFTDRKCVLDSSSHPFEIKSETPQKNFTGTFSTQMTSESENKSIDKNGKRNDNDVKSPSKGNELSTANGSSNETQSKPGCNQGPSPKFQFDTPFSKPLPTRPKLDEGPCFFYDSRFLADFDEEFHARKADHFGHQRRRALVAQAMRERASSALCHQAKKTIDLVTLQQIIKERKARKTKQDGTRQATNIDEERVAHSGETDPSAVNKRIHDGIKKVGLGVNLTALSVREYFDSLKSKKTNKMAIEDTQKITTKPQIKVVKEDELPQFSSEILSTRPELIKKRAKSVPMATSSSDNNISRIDEEGFLVSLTESMDETEVSTYGSEDERLTGLETETSFKSINEDPSLEYASKSKLVPSKSNSHARESEDAISTNRTVINEAMVTLHDDVPPTKPFFKKTFLDVSLRKILQAGNGIVTNEQINPPTQGEGAKIDGTASEREIQARFKKDSSITNIRQRIDFIKKTRPRNLVFINENDISRMNAAEVKTMKLLRLHRRKLYEI